MAHRICINLSEEASKIYNAIKGNVNLSYDISLMIIEKYKPEDLQKIIDEQKNKVKDLENIRTNIENSKLKLNPEERKYVMDLLIIFKTPYNPQTQEKVAKLATEKFDHTITAEEVRKVSNNIIM